MPSTGTRKKKSTAGRKTTRKKTPSAKKRQKQAYNRELVTEITILITLAVSVLLVISNFDIGGKVGTVISQFFFGLFGWDGLSVSGSSVYGNCICYRKL